MFDHWTQSVSLRYQCSWERTQIKQACLRNICWLSMHGTHCAPRWTACFKVSPGGVHASTEDWTNTDRLLEGIGIFLSLYFAKAAWTASVCKSERTHRQRLATQLKKKNKSAKVWRLSIDTQLPDLKRSSRVFAARDLLCLELGRTAWEEAWILLSICREGSTPAQRHDRNRTQS